MSLQRMPAEQALARMVSGEGFSTIIDARSEGEFALDHLPGAVNWPSLNDEQRIVIGTLFKEKGGFEAQKLGAAWVAVNIARHIERDVLSLPKNWQPLVYCWRGGKRSGALSMVQAATCVFNALDTRIWSMRKPRLRRNANSR